jgi:hypothetical protein
VAPNLAELEVAKCNQATEREPALNSVIRIDDERMRHQRYSIGRQPHSRWAAENENCNHRRPILWPPGGCSVSGGAVSFCS